ncbi:tripartite tricarboxylate transporter substrate binding protein [Variovorax sp. J22G21]|uniref:Bug family tripartite tricarboxylate transporter substrate binding protein n=1 Tax=Variovorax fucosicus TaxID=3053517 RepID=UPI002576E9E8|nr:MULTISPECIES: tripartite tricarboxylate transporter substrate binding protein [unclassified Variovorax]MDM0041330.1 tripartite tricarboxylate transporter substrate binding protein [Variovorax sp. J22R193]MDM0060387.1 tripartite tricarboxylate transporter substrate binding protein [Variovorax sp. J22G21]
MIYSKFLFGTLIAASMAFGSAVAQPITKIVVPFAAGGGTDVYVRMLAQEMTNRGTRVIVENRPGGSAVVAADYVAKAKPDGQTLVVSFLGMLGTNVLLFDKLPYDPKKDFTSVSQIAYQPTIMVGRSELPYRNLKEMVEYAKANPGKINRGSPGAAILSNLAPITFERSLGISTNHIPFNGDAQAIQAMLSDSIDIYGTSITSSLPHIKSGKFRVLGVMGGERLPQAPDAPTFKEQGYNFEAPLRYYLSATGGSPKEVVDKLNRAINEVLADHAFIERARAIGMEPRGGSPQEMDTLLSAEIERWNPVVKSLNLPKSDKQ